MAFTYQVNWEAPPFFNSAEDPFANFKTDIPGHQTDIFLREQQAWCQVDYSPMSVSGTPGPYTPFSPADSSTTSEDGSDSNASYREHDQALSPLPYGSTPDIARGDSMFNNSLGSSSDWSAPLVYNISYTALNHQMATMAAIALEPTFMNASYEQGDQLDFMNYADQTGPEAQNSMTESQTYTQISTYSNKTSASTKDDNDEEGEVSSFLISAFETSVDDANDPDYYPSNRPVTAIKRASNSAKPTTRGQHVLSPRSTGIEKPKHIPRRTSRISLDNSRTIYPCVFRWAGCQSEFSAKNEWKRHVSTQHLGLQYWQCRLETCGEEKTGKDGKTVKYKNDSHVFNRKDLFTQHIRRQHVPVALKVVAARKGNEGSLEERGKLKAWEKEAQDDALFLRRQPLNDSTCPIRGCKHTFTGKKGWDDRMEHLGKHFEKGECDKGQDLGAGGLREWALEAGALDHFNGDWRFLDDNVEVMS